MTLPACFTGEAPAARRKRPIARPRHAHPLVRQLVDLLNESPVTLRDVGRRAGLAGSTIGSWWGSANPTIHNFDAVLNTIGFELRICPKNPDGDQHA